MSESQRKHRHTLDILDSTWAGLHSVKADVMQENINADWDAVFRHLVQLYDNHKQSTVRMKTW